MVKKQHLPKLKINSTFRPFFASSRSLIREALDHPTTVKPKHSILEKVKYAFC